MPSLRIRSANGSVTRAVAASLSRIVNDSCLPLPSTILPSLITYPACLSRSYAARSSAWSLPLPSVTGSV